MELPLTDMEIYRITLAIIRTEIQTDREDVICQLYHQLITLAIFII